MASRATSRLNSGMGGASQYDREPSDFGYGSERDRQDGDPVDRILTSLDRLGERIRTLSPVDDRRASRPMPRASEPDDLQRAIEQISRKRDAFDPARVSRREGADVAELGARVRALSQEMNAERRRKPALNDGLATEVADLRAEVERLIETNSGRSLEGAFDTLVARLDDIRTSVDNPRLVGDLVQRLAEIRRLIATLPSGDQVGVITSRLDRLAERLDQGLGDQRVLGDFGRSLSDLAAAVAQLDKREVIAAIERRLDDVAGSIRAIERDVGDFSLWKDGLDRQNATLSQVAQRSEQLPRFAHELERQSASIERIARSTEGLPRLAEEIDGLRLSLDRAGVALDADAIRALDERFAELGRSLEAQLRPASSGLPDDLSAALSRIEAKLSAPVPTGRISEIEDRIAVLTRSMADIDFATSKDVSALERAVEHLRDDVLAAAGRPDAGLASDVRTLVERLDRLDAPAIGADAFERLENRIADIASRLETRPNEISALAEALERLDATMSSSLSVEAIADRVAAAAGRNGEDGPVRLANVEAGINRLGEDLRADAERDRGLLLAIGQTVERLALREVGEDGARTEASETNSSHGKKDNWEEIEQALTRRVPPVAESEESEDLPRIFGRKPSPAPRVEPQLGKPPLADGDEPVLPPGFDVNKPLEPGSGKPRLPKSAPAAERPAVSDATRAPTKADFIAAARRAAQAAGSGAQEDAGKQDAPASGKSRFALPKVGFNLRKMAMAAAAILIVLGLAKIATDTLNRFSTSDAAPAAVPAAPEPTASTSTAPEALAPAPVVQSPAPEPQATEPSSETAPAIMPPASSEMAPPQATTPPVGFSQMPSTLPTDGFVPTSESPQASAETSTAPVATPPPSLPEAMGSKALRDAAASGDPQAAFEVASRFADGRGVPQDLSAAIDWYRRSAEAGLAPAQYRLGSMYEKGVGTARDAKTAAEWYTKAAALGNAKAMHNLAVINAEGGLGKPDYAQAAKWFQDAAEHGIRDSQFNLGILYARGLGVPRDLATSYKWFALAATGGDADSAKKRDDIAQVLSKDDLARARLAVETWVPKPLDPKAEDVPPTDPAWAAPAEHTASVDTSRTIARTQAILASLGFDAGPADGKMGRKTRDAIAAFQTSKGMPATGEIDRALIEALGMPTI
ncbi:peptidoglycan-binding protein [Pleomorphomonas sp. JP5]|uniref:peptidoglycan-binding protein n=1 Tax=Pleomorphomonas sp. JP5 TaxID=2942998 RepID=UPI0020445D02|nr:peptidoglycan-binding protein [Pleomorphomonas sp. JP5]MCM5558187.1 peptidoglycan-binding protein [Pleomorphomonas sp. JP5]